MQTSRTDREQFQPRRRLSDARIAKGWSQQTFADKLGTTYVNVSRWERGLTKPGPFFRPRICALLEKTEDELGLGPPTLNTWLRKSYELPELPVPLEFPGHPEVATLPDHAADNGAPVPADVQAIQGNSDSLSQNAIHTSENPATLPQTPAPNALYDPAIPILGITRLIGREQEVERLKQRLFTGNSAEGNIGASVALTALNGIPGVGKTALATALACDQDIRAHFRDGVLWAGLGPIPNVQGLLSRWGSLLGLSSSVTATLNSMQTWARALRDAIGSRAFLIVIDDVWEYEHALTLKVGGPSCAHLITTRSLDIAGRVTTGGATFVRELGLGESISLLELITPEVVKREPQKTLELVNAVGGLPLALTLIGNYLRLQAYSGHFRRVQAALDKLRDVRTRLELSEPQGGADSHSSLLDQQPLSLRSVIAVTDQRLRNKERAALYALSVIPPKPNSFSAEAVLAVANCSYDVLDTLLDTGLLESSGEDRYTLHQVIADYARIYLNEDPNAEAEAIQRLISYITAYVVKHKKDYELLDREETTIFAALELAYERGYQAALVRAVVALSPFFLVRAMYDEAKQQLERALEMAIALDDSYGFANTHLYLGEIAQKRGEYEQAEIHFQEGLKRAREIEDPDSISAILMLLGGMNWRRGAYAQAEAYLQEGLKLARLIDNTERICGILKSLGPVAIGLGTYSQAEAYLQEGLSLARQIGDLEYACSILANLGLAANEQGKYEVAEKYFREGLVLARQLRHHEWISGLLINLGDALVEQRNYEQAEEYFLEGLDLARKIGHSEWTCLSLINLGLTARKQENYSQAKEYLSESLHLARQFGIPQMTAYILCEYGDLYIDQQEVQLASTMFHEMLATVPEGVQDLIALAQYGLARVAFAQGNIQEAQRLVEVSRSTLEAIGHRRTEEVRLWQASIWDSLK